MSDNRRKKEGIDGYNKRDMSNDRRKKEDIDGYNKKDIDMIDNRRRNGNVETGSDQGAGDVLNDGRGVDDYNKRSKEKRGGDLKTYEDKDGSKQHSVEEQTRSRENEGRRDHGISFNS